MLLLEVGREHRHRHRVGDKCALRLRVTPLDPAVTRVRLRVSGDDTFPEQRLDLAPVAVGQATHPVAVQWIPAVAGEEIIRVEGDVLNGRRRCGAFVCDVDVRVEGRDAGHQHVVYNVQAERISGVDMSARVEAAQPPPGLAGAVAAFAWEEQPLRWLSLRGLVRDADAPHATQAWVEWHEGEAVVPRRVLVTNVESPSLGRHSSCDLVLRFMPESEENIQRSHGISRDHAGIEVDSSGVPHLCCRGSAPTFLDGVRILPGTRHPVPPGGRQLTLGLAGLELDVHPVDDELPDAWGSYIAVCEDLGAVRPHEHRPAAVSVRRRNNAPELQYLWLRRSVVIGSNGDAGLRVRGAAPCHARLITAAQRFVLEALEPLQINGAPIEPGALHELPAAADVTLGGVTLRWELAVRPS